MFAATVTLLAIYLLLHYSTRDLFACDLPDIYLVQAEHIGSTGTCHHVLVLTNSQKLRSKEVVKIKWKNAKL